MGRKLKYRIMAVGMTQRELADRVGVQEKYISYYISGIKKPSLETAIRMAQALHCKIDDIV